MSENQSLTIAQAVAEELGPEWTASANHNHCATLTDGEVEVFARVGTYGADRGRIVFSTAYPGRWTDVIRSADEGHRVATTAAVDRSPKAIAAQVSRTVLPAVREWTPIIEERLRGLVTAEDNRQAALERIRTVCPSAHDVRGDATDVSLYPAGDWYGDVRLRHAGDRGDVHLRGLSIGTILAILELAKEDTVSSS